ncbi:MAG: pentapeptide repeat-containing protein [Bauldia sp.]|nr:pentapeptide repeat-containing protein [Bauldia sp.]
MKRRSVARPDAPAPGRARTAVAALLLGCTVTATTALAQSPPVPMEIFHITLGTSIYAVDEADFWNFACGTNGGPPALPLAGFSAFMSCRPEESGLREVYFEYDDERLYWAKAHRYTETVAAMGAGTRVYGIDAILSVLIDEDGIVEGWRIVADPRPDFVPHDRLFQFGYLALYQFGGEDDWECTDYPPADGRESVDGLFVDRECFQSEGDVERRVRIEHYRKPGQTRFNPDNQRLNVGSFSLFSAARLDIMRDTDLPPAGPVLPPPEPAAAPEATGDAVADFLTGASNACPGCDLTGADLKRRNLAGADLAGAVLTNANLHRANLADAILAGADLTGANLNRASLLRADLSGADLTGAMAFDADMSRANLAGATLHNLMAGEARLVLADLSGTAIDYGDFRDARMMNVNLQDAVVRLTYFDRANFFQADLSGVRMVPGSFWGANLRGVNAAGADMTGSDFLEADLSGADLTGTNLSGTRLFRAKLFQTNTSETTMTGAILPNGEQAP